MIRRQISLFLRAPERNALDEIRARIDPWQQSIIPAHITLCRDEDTERWLSAGDKKYPHCDEPVRFRVCSPERTEGGGVLLPVVCVDSSYARLRAQFVAHGADSYRPHITLLHPRNARPGSPSLEQIRAFELPREVTVSSVVLIEQHDEGIWQERQCFATDGSGLSFRRATPDDAAGLTDLALRSKSHWGYSEEFMAACRDELTVTAEDILGEEVSYVIAETDAGVAGYYGLATMSSTSHELDALFVEPAHIGQRIGRALLKHALGRIAAAGGGRLTVHSDPHAEPFYLAAGGKPRGSAESGSVPGRQLPLIEFDV